MNGRKRKKNERKTERQTVKEKESQITNIARERPNDSFVYTEK